MKPTQSQCMIAHQIGAALADQAGDAAAALIRAAKANSPVLDRQIEHTIAECAGAVPKRVIALLHEFYGGDPPSELIAKPDPDRPRDGRALTSAANGRRGGRPKLPDTKSVYVLYLDPCMLAWARAQGPAAMRARIAEWMGR